MESVNPGIEVVRAQERQRIHGQTEIERTWWPRTEKFITLDEARKAKEQGILISTPKTDGNYRLIGRLGDENGEPDLVRPETLLLLKEVSSVWREKVGESNRNIQLAVTSLYRGSDLQSALTSGSNGYLAVGCEESSHSAGAAFDISLRSYYVQDDKGVRGVQSWNPDSGFDPSVLQPLPEILNGISGSGTANYVIESNINEVGDATPSVLHVCASPLSSLAQAA